MTLEQRSQMLTTMRETALANVRIAETALESAEREFRRIEAELDEVSELRWEETSRRLRRSAS